MGVGIPISLDEYLRTSYRPDCDFVDGQIVERNVGLMRHARALAKISCWLHKPGLQPLIAVRTQVSPSRVRVPDVVVCRMPLPEEEIVTTPPYLCVEVVSPEDTMFGMQERIDEYLAFGVPNVWVIDPWKHRGWRVTQEGWITASDGVMRTADRRLAMPLSDVLLP
jgi:Uma2 family endonuclease